VATGLAVGMREATGAEPVLTPVTVVDVALGIATACVLTLAVGVGVVVGSFTTGALSS